MSSASVAAAKLSLSTIAAQYAHAVQHPFVEAHEHAPQSLIDWSRCYRELSDALAPQP
jgi:hypothetical protein